MSLVPFTSSAPTGALAPTGAPVSERINAKALNYLDPRQGIPQDVTPDARPSVPLRKTVPLQMTIDKPGLLVLQDHPQSTVFGAYFPLRDGQTDQYDSPTLLSVPIPMDNIDAFRFTSTLFSIQADQLSTTNFTLSGRITAVKLWNIPQEVDANTIASLTTAPMAIAPNIRLCDGMVCISYPYENPWVDPQSPTKNLQRHVGTEQSINSDDPVRVYLGAHRITDYGPVELYIRSNTDYPVLVSYQYGAVGSRIRARPNMPIILNPGPDQALEPLEYIDVLIEADNTRDDVMIFVTNASFPWGSFDGPVTLMSILGISEPRAVSMTYSLSWEMHPTSENAITHPISYPSCCSYVPLDIVWTLLTAPGSPVKLFYSPSEYNALVPEFAGMTRHSYVYLHADHTGGAGVGYAADSNILSKAWNWIKGNAARGLDFGKKVFNTGRSLVHTFAPAIQTGLDILGATNPELLPVAEFANTVVGMASVPEVVDYGLAATPAEPSYDGLCSSPTQPEEAVRYFPVDGLCMSFEQKKKEKTSKTRARAGKISSGMTSLDTAVLTTPPAPQTSATSYVSPLSDDDDEESSEWDNDDDDEPPGTDADEAVVPFFPSEAVIARVPIPKAAAATGAIVDISTMLANTRHLAHSFERDTRYEWDTEAIKKLDSGKYAKLTPESRAKLQEQWIESDARMLFPIGHFLGIVQPDNINKADPAFIVLDCERPAGVEFRQIANTYVGNPSMPFQALKYFQVDTALLGMTDDSANRAMTAIIAAMRTGFLTGWLSAPKHRRRLGGSELDLYDNFYIYIVNSAGIHQWKNLGGTSYCGALALLMDGNPEPMFFSAVGAVIHQLPSSRLTQNYYVADPGPVEGVLAKVQAWEDAFAAYPPQDLQWSPYQMFLGTNSIQPNTGVAVVKTTYQGADGKRHASEVTYPSLYDTVQAIVKAKELCRVEFRVLDPMTPWSPTLPSASIGTSWVPLMMPRRMYYQNEREKAFFAARQGVKSKTFELTLDPQFFTAMEKFVEKLETSKSKNMWLTLVPYFGSPNVVSNVVRSLKPGQEAKAWSSVISTLQDPNIAAGIKNPNTDKSYTAQQWFALFGDPKAATGGTKTLLPGVTTGTVKQAITQMKAKIAAQASAKSA